MVLTRKGVCPWHRGNQNNRQRHLHRHQSQRHHPKHGHSHHQHLCRKHVIKTIIMIIIIILIMMMINASPNNHHFLPRLSVGSYIHQYNRQQPKLMMMITNLIIPSRSLPYDKYDDGEGNTLFILILFVFSLSSSSLSLSLSFQRGLPSLSTSWQSGKGGLDSS